MFLESDTHGADSPFTNYNNSAKHRAYPAGTVTLLKQMPVDISDEYSVIKIQSLARRRHATKVVEGRRLATHEAPPVDAEVKTSNYQATAVVPPTPILGEDDDTITLPTEEEVEAYLGDDPCASTQRGNRVAQQVAALASQSPRKTTQSPQTIPAADATAHSNFVDLPSHVRVALLNQQSEACAAKRPHPFTTADFGRGIAIKEEGTPANGLVGLKVFLSSQQAYW